jgi:hypothetical protein
MMTDSTPTEQDSARTHKRPVAWMILAGVAIVAAKPSRRAPNAMWPEPRRNRRARKLSKRSLCTDASLAATQALAESDDAAEGYEAAASSAETAASACS